MAFSTQGYQQASQHEKPLTRLGPYQIEAVLGYGGVSTVYKARRPNAQSVALKVLYRATAAQPAIRQRFQQEYKILSQLHHSGIVRVWDFGELEGHFYMALDLLQGETLEDLLSRSKTVGEVTAIAIARQIADVLDYMHGENIVHRDIKTSNIMVTAGRRIILFDFGTVLNRSAPEPEDLSGLYGTPPFVAPEQAEGRVDVDGRADLYSLGIILYRMITGRKPFYGSRSEVLHAHIHTQPPAPSRFAHVSPELEDVILKALAKDPAQRFQTGAELVQALDSVHLTPEEPSLPQQVLRWLRLPTHS